MFTFLHLSSQEENLISLKKKKSFSYRSKHVFFFPPTRLAACMDDGSESTFGNEWQQAKKEEEKITRRKSIFGFCFEIQLTGCCRVLHFFFFGRMESEVMTGRDAQERPVGSSVRECRCIRSCSLKRVPKSNGKREEKRRNWQRWHSYRASFRSLVSKVSTENPLPQAGFEKAELK